MNSTLDDDTQNHPVWIIIFRTHITVGNKNKKNQSKPGKTSATVDSYGNWRKIFVFVLTVQDTSFLLPHTTFSLYLRS